MGLGQELPLWYWANRGARLIPNDFFVFTQLPTLFGYYESTLTRAVIVRGKPNKEPIENSILNIDAHSTALRNGPASHGTWRCWENARFYLYSHPKTSCTRELTPPGKSHFYPHLSETWKQHNSCMLHWIRKIHMHLNHLYLTFLWCNCELCSFCICN